MKILVSACLVGINCRYDGRTSSHEFPELNDENVCVIPVCPEQLGGLPTPRPASSIVGGNGFDVLDGNARVISQDGQNVTDCFMKGARETLKIAKKLGVNVCYFKDKSPSCGLKLRMDNTGEILGPGVTAALFLRENYRVIEIEASATP